MLKNKSIAVISANCLVGVGLKSFLTDYFEADDITLFLECPSFFEAESVSSFDFIFIPSESYVLFNEQFNNIRNRLIILTENDIPGFPSNMSLSVLDITKSQSEIISSMEEIFTSKIKQNLSENQDVLSFREVEVLKLVACGLMNKQIADQLSISLHTVVSHRKNITRKLGINTVSGLTVYAMINGLITTADLQAANQ
jgi:DNA-binding CsgD family transcriptional regulator